MTDSHEPRTEAARELLDSATKGAWVNWAGDPVNLPGLARELRRIEAEAAAPSKDDTLRFAKTIRDMTDEAIRLIETGENRAMAADGPVPHFRGELDDIEWRRLWLALSGLRAALAATSPTPKETL